MIKSTLRQITPFWWWVYGLACVCSFLVGYVAAFLQDVS